MVFAAAQGGLDGTVLIIVGAILLFMAWVAYKAFGPRE